jgi:two-component system, chemotaxis family, protein-glutamate methylesterase/glutaminase
MTTFSSDAAQRRVNSVLVVDDSDLMRSLLRAYIGDTGRFEVAGEAGTGYEAIRQVHELDPDIITLDLQMPDLGGVEALGYIMSEAPRPVVIVSSHSEALADPVLQAMMLGAVEFVAKPASRDAAEVAAFRQRLEQALHAAATARLLNLPQRQLLAQRRAAAASAARPARCAVAVAASTGGPRALAEVLPQLPAGLPAAVLVVQHMPAAFTGALARRLDEACALPVREAVDDEALEDGVVYIAPGGRHFDLVRRHDGVRVRLSDEPPVWGVRPAADVLFAAVGRIFGPASVAVVMTGMGRDGAEGTRVIRDAGGAALTQDEASSVIPGMPRAAAPFAAAEVPLTELAAAITESVARQAQARKLP